MLGGALGNVGDRVFRAPGVLRGHVVDFISLLSPYGSHFAIFNAPTSHSPSASAWRSCWNCWAGIGTAGSSRITARGRRFTGTCRLRHAGSTFRDIGRLLVTRRLRHPGRLLVTRR